MIIGLMGFEFESANKGCEALSYSFLSMLNNTFADAKITIYNFSNCGLGEVPKYFHNFDFVRVPLKIRDYSFNMIRHIIKCDVVFDITMGDSFSDIYSKEVCLSNIRFKTLAEIFSRNYVLLPQTYGPFYDKKVLRRAIMILKKAGTVFCRDALSSDYLKEKCKVTNAKIITDIAFTLPYDQKAFDFDPKTFHLGINISGLLWRGGFTENNQFGLKLDYRKYINFLIKYFGEKPEISVHLIPHVIDVENDAYDDDYKVCHQILNDYDSLHLAPEFRTPMEAKSYIANMDFFIGARMHSTIAAISSGVPTIPVSYSRKFEGLYGNLGYDYVLSARILSTNEAISKTVEWVEKRDDLRQACAAAMDTANSRLELFYRELAHI